MTDFRPQRDELLEQSCLSYQAQFPLPAPARHALAELSRKLQQNVPRGLWAAPADSLHVTCHSLISPREAFDKHRYWRETSSLAAEALKRIEFEVPAFALCFRNLRATNRAVIVLADDEPSVEAARAIFRLIPPPAARPLQISTTIHATICRYGDPAGIPRDLSRIAERLRPDVHAAIDRLLLVRETIYPSLKTETLLSASLAPG
jgi:hypothetical protein